MALTVNSAVISNGMPSAPLQLKKLNVTLDASYPTGGYAKPTELSGFTVCPGLFGIVGNGTTALKLAFSADGKLQAFVHATGAEVAGATDLSSYSAVDVPVFVQ